MYAWFLMVFVPLKKWRSQLAFAPDQGRLADVSAVKSKVCTILGARIAFPAVDSLSTSGAAFICASGHSKMEAMARHGRTAAGKANTLSGIRSGFHERVAEAQILLPVKSGNTVDAAADVVANPALCGLVYERPRGGVQAAASQKTIYRGDFKRSEKLTLRVGVFIKDRAGDVERPWSYKRKHLVLVEG
jgi:hypothetical protein